MMASCAPRLFNQSLVGLRTCATTSFCSRRAIAAPFSLLFQSTQAAPPLIKAIKSIANVNKPITQPLQSRHASTLSQAVEKRDWRSIFRNAYYGPSGSSKKDLPQPSHITSPEDSPLFQEWTYPLFIWGFVVVNGLILLAHEYADHLSKQGHPALLNFMTKNFTAYHYNGNWWTLITDCFTHDSLTSYVFSMLSFVYIAPPLVTLLGPMAFLGVYIGAGVATRIASTLYNKSEYKRRRDAAGIARIKAKGEKMVEVKKETRGFGAPAAQVALASILAMVDSRSKMLLIVLPIYTRILLPIAFFGVTFPHLLPAGVISSKVDSSSLVTPMFFGLLFWRIGLRGKQFT